MRKEKLLTSPDPLPIHCMMDTAITLCMDARNLADGLPSQTGQWIGNGSIHASISTSDKTQAGSPAKHLSDKQRVSAEAALNKLHAAFLALWRAAHGDIRLPTCCPIMTHHAIWQI